MQMRYRQIASELISRVREGRYRPGTPLPGRIQLAEEFSVARATIDKSVEILVKKGVALSQPGSGTYVNPDRFLTQIALVSGSYELENLPETLKYEGVWQTDNQLLVKHLPYSRLTGGAGETNPDNYDGIIWYLPDDNVLEHIENRAGVTPQIVLNREVMNKSYICFDHRESVRTITGERLRLLPEATPVFLRTEDVSKKGVTALREEGFLEACRAERRFYEILELPPVFEKAYQKLSETFGAQPKRPLLIVSHSRFHTGAVVLWARDQGLRWQRDIFYSDFDNRFAEHVWGLRVTTFLQDFRQLLEQALLSIQELIAGSKQTIQLLIPPQRVNGDT
jgi:DNA-binding transcriptional regulator YhcF (GntR family)